MSVRTDVVNLNVNVNGNKAQAELNNLRKRAADIKLEMEGLKKGTEAYIAKKAELKGVTDQMDNLKKNIGLTSLSQKELLKELKTLNALKGSVQPFTKEFKDLDKQIKAVENRLYDVKNGVTGFASFFSKIKDEVKQFGVMAAGYLGFQFITSQFQSIISGSGKLSDSLADVRKSTGLTTNEVKNLNSELGQMDTRTSNQKLRDLAVDAGKLGIEGKENILEFVKAADKINVALGEDLGDDAVKDIGKLVDIFRLKEQFGLGDSMLKVGSAINDVGAASSASESYIVDFMKRMGGIGPSAKISVPDLVALAGTLDSLGQTSESSSTAVGNTIGKLVTDFEGFGKIAGLTGAELKAIFNKDGGLAALKAVLDGVNKSGGDFDVLVSKLGDVGVEGAKAKGVFAVLANNLDVLEKQQKVANESFEKGTSITQEFSIKNETFAATLEKLSKEFNRLVTSAPVTEFLKSAVNGVTDFIRFLKDLPTWINENRTALIALTGVILTYITAKTKSTQASVLNKVATMLEVGADKLAAVQKVALTAVTTGYGVAKDLLTGKIKLATIAQQAWNLVAKANPAALVVAGVSALAVGISALSDKLRVNTSEMKNNADIHADVAKANADTKNEVETLTAVIASSTATDEEKAIALQKLKDIGGEYLEGLTMENVATEEGIGIIRRYIGMLDQLADAKARVNLKAKLKEQILETDNTRMALEAEKAGAGTTWTGDGDLFGIELFGRTKDIVERDIKKQDDAKQQLTNRLKALDSENEKQINFYREQIARKNDELKKLGADSAEGKRLAMEVANDQKALFILTGLDGAAAPGAGGGTGSGGNAVTANNAVTLAKLKKQKSDLEQAYQDIDITNEKALANNRAQRKRLQDQIDRIEGRSSKDNEYERLKKEAEKFHQDVLKLKRNAVIKSKEPEEEEIAAVQAKYEELTAKAKAYLAKNIIDKKRFGEDEKALEEAKQQELNNIFQKYFKKRQEEAASKEYEGSLASSAEYFEQRKKQLALEYSDGIINKRQYDAAIKDLDRQALSDRIIIAGDYAESVKKAAEDVKAFRKQQEQQTTADIVEETNKRIATAESERLAKAQRAVITSRPGTDNRLKAQKDLLQLQFELDTQYLNQKSELYLTKEAELQERLKDLDRQAKLGKINNIMDYVGFFQSAIASLHDFLTSRENRQLAQDKKANDTKKKTYKAQLDNKLISQSQYDKKVAQLEEEQQKKETELKRKQAKREKAINLFNAIVSNAAAIAKTMASVAFPFNIPLAIAQGIAGGLQVAAIANTPLPELGTGDWVRKGAKHKDPEGGIPVMIERDEAVITADAMTDNTVYKVTGTTAQITSALNSRGGGVSWAGGASVVEMPKWRTQRPASINPNMPRIMEQGGIVRRLDGTEPETDDQTPVLLRELIAKQDENTAEIRTMKTKLHAVVSIKEYREQEAIYEAAKKAAGMDQ